MMMSLLEQMKDIHVGAIRTLPGVLLVLRFSGDWRRLIGREYFLLRDEMSNGRLTSNKH